MKILALSDTQIGSGKHLWPDRLDDQRRMLDHVARIAHEEHVDALVHCGDVFHSRHPGEEERVMFRDFVRLLLGKPLYIVAGNHDLRGREAATAVDLYEGERVVYCREPMVALIDGTEDGPALCSLPWVPSGSRSNAEMSELLVRTAGDMLRGPALPFAPRILALHWAVSGNTLPTGLPVEQIAEPVIPVEELEAIGYDLILCGHIHSAGVLNVGRSGGRIVSLGSPWVNDWGEVGGMHGVWIWNPEARHFEDKLVHHGLDDRPFVKIDWDSPAGELGSPRVENAVVRVRYEAEEPYDHDEIEARLRSFGAARVIFDPIITPRTRARVEGIGDTDNPLEHVELWIAAQDPPLDEEQAQSLREFVGEKLAELS